MSSVESACVFLFNALALVVEVTRTLALQLELERHEREQREQEIENLRKRVEKMEQEKVDKDETISAESPEEAAARRRRREWIMGLGDKPASSKAMPTVPESAPVTTVPSPTTHYAEPQPGNVLRVFPVAVSSSGVMVVLSGTGQLFSNLQVSPAATTYQSYAFGYDPTQVCARDDECGALPTLHILLPARCAAESNVVWWGDGVLPSGIWSSCCRRLSCWRLPCHRIRIWWVWVRPRAVDSVIRRDNRLLLLDEQRDGRIAVGGDLRVKPPPTLPLHTATRVH